MLACTSEKNLLNATTNHRPREQSFRNKLEIHKQSIVSDWFWGWRKNRKSTSRAIPEHVHSSVVEGSEVLGRRTRELAREPPRGICRSGLYIRNPIEVKIMNNSQMHACMLLLIIINVFSRKTHHHPSNVFCLKMQAPRFQFKMVIILKIS